MRRIAKSSIARFIVIFLISFALCIGAVFAYVSNLSHLEVARMEQLAMTGANKVNDVLTKLLYKSQVLAAFVQQNGNNEESFDKISAVVVDDPSIRNVLLAPNGVVNYVYPLKGNESVLGLDFFSKGTGNAEAVMARDTGQLVLGGPFELVQGGYAIVGRNPVYIEKNNVKEFWGITSVTLNYPEALRGAGLEELKAQGYAYEIWRVNPDTGKNQTIAKNDWESKKNTHYVEYPMNILNAQWYFRVSPIRVWYQFPQTWLFLFVGLLLSILVGSLFIQNFELSGMKKELLSISMNDMLTGTANRRACLKLLHNLVDNRREPFVICYIDLDNFKEINDRYGHSNGDTALKYFVDETNKVLDAYGNRLFRIGGDEFIIIFSDMSSQEQTYDILNNIRKRLGKKFSLSNDGIDFKIGFSTGFAEYPKDGKTVDELIFASDERMYEAKKTKEIY